MSSDQATIDRGEINRPGTVTTLTISIFTVVCLVAATLILLFILKPDWRPSVIFIASVLAAGGTITSAFYAVENVRIASKNILITSGNINRGIRDNRIVLSFSFMERWNSPNFSDSKSRCSAILRDLRDKSDDVKRSTLEGDLTKRATMVDIFNFFEEMEIAIKNQVVEEQILKDFFKGLVVLTFNTTEPWVRSHRINQPRALLEVEALRNRWQ